MFFKYNEEFYEVIIQYKNNKNLYLRVKDDLKIYITSPKHFKEEYIKKFLEDNEKTIIKFIETVKTKQEKNNGKFLFLGKKYDVCYINEKKIIFGSEKVFIGKNVDIDKFYKKEAEKIFKERYNVCFDIFNYSIKPFLKIRKMKSKWGVCNITNNTITLNLDLIKLDLKYLDYVIYHELSHLHHPNHSKKFWSLVSKYVPNYKQIRKEMKGIL